MFQPNGVAPSLLKTCDHLVSQGYSPFILSNTQLADHDREALLARAALLLERPNFGYDFGAYQDGIKLLNQMGCKPDRLILMNDSTWFPLRENDTSIARMEASGDHFVGHVFKFEPKIRRGRDHIEAHFLLFDRNAQDSIAFKNFWDRYLMTSSRSETIQRGEKGISTAMFNAGFGSQGLTSKTLLLDHLAKEKFIELKKMLVEACFDNNILREETLHIISAASETPEWRTQVITHVRTVIEAIGTTLYCIYIYYTMTKLGLGFVKKANNDFFHFTRVKVLELEAAGEIEPLDCDVRSEMTASVAGWTPQQRRGPN